MRGLLRVPFDGLFTSSDAGTAPPLTGQQLGAYSVKELLGKGGMGEVYDHDAQLGRDVGVEDPATDAFTNRSPIASRASSREAQVLASLNHPNIAADLRTRSAADGRSTALVLELVEGSTLAERIASGRITVPRSARYRHGRSLKRWTRPTNAAIVHRDFEACQCEIERRLARSRCSTSDSRKTIVGAPIAVATRSKTAARRTRAGCLLGTVPYMSPGAGSRSRRSTSARTSGPSAACSADADGPAPPSPEPALPTCSPPSSRRRPTGRPYRRRRFRRR